MKRIMINEICEVYDGPHATPIKTEHGPVYLGIDAITEDGMLDSTQFSHLSEEDYIKWTKRVTPQENDIVFSYEATLGRYTMIPKGFHGCLGRRLAIIRNVSNKINTRWLYYYFRSPEWTSFIRNQTVKGSTVDRISVEEFPKYTVPLIPIGEQNKIVDVLDKIDRKIANNKKINDYLEQKLRLLYEHMMSNVQTGEVTGHNTIASALTNIITGKEDANFASPIGKYKFFTCSNDTLRCDKYVFNASSILIAGNGDFNVKHYTGRFNAYQRTYVLMPEQKYYGLLYLASLYQINSFKSASAGSIVKFITKGDIENIPVFIPDNEEVLGKINHLLILQEQYQVENDELASLRDWLLPMLMNCQATIED